MRIYHRVELQAAHARVVSNALIDTGAELSMIPSSAASMVGAWLTNHSQSVVGVHQDTRTFPLVLVDVSFGDLRVGGRFAFVMSDIVNEVIIGMDVLKRLGLSIDVAADELSVKNRAWEVFKTVAAVGVLILGGAKVLESA